jgi:hypothetical protein
MGRVSQGGSDEAQFAESLIVACRCERQRVDMVAPELARGLRAVMVYVTIQATSKLGPYLMYATLPLAGACSYQN